MSFKKLLGGVAVAAIIATPATIIPTEKGWAQVGVITVTTRRREESLQDIPLSVTAFGTVDIQRKGITNLEDVSRLTPGLTFDLGFLPQDTRPSIRGLPATRGRPPAGILLDGIDVSSESVQTAGGGSLLNLRLVDIERVEVVKGPQSALYGRTAFGGAINYISRKPPEEFAVSAYGDFGSDGQAEIRGSVGGPVVEDTLLVKLNGAYARHDGFFRNTVTGAKIGGTESYGGALALTWNATDSFTAQGRVSYSEDMGEVRPVSSFSAGNGTAILEPIAPSALGLTVPDTMTPGVFVPIGTSVSNPPFGITLDHPAPIALSANPLTDSDYPGSEVKNLLASLKLDWDVGFATISSWTGYANSDAFQFQDSDRVGLPQIPYVPGSTFPAGLPAGALVEPLARSTDVNFSTETKQISQELRIGDLEDETFRWAVGGLFWKEDVDQISRSVATVLIPVVVIPPPGTPVFSADANTKLIADQVTSRPQVRDTTHYSVYATAEVDFWDNFTFGFEGRYTWESFDYSLTDGSFAFAAVVVPFGPGPAAFPPIGGPALASSSDQYFTPRITLEYDATDLVSACGCDDLNLYVSGARGVKPGGFSTLNFNTAVGLDELRFQPETLWSQEVGLKSIWYDGALQFNLAAFHTSYKGKQDTQQVIVPPPQNFQTVVRNNGDARIWGVELDAAIAPPQIEGLTLSASYTYLKTKYTDFDFLATSVNDIARAGNCMPQDTSATIPGDDACIVDLTGNRLERQPKHSVVGTVSYVRPLFGEVDILAEVGIQFQGNRFLAKWNRWLLDSYINVDARVGLQGEGWSIIGYVDNVTNDDTVRSAQENFDVFAFATAIHTFHTDPRHFGVRLGIDM